MTRTRRPTMAAVGNGVLSMTLLVVTLSSSLIVANGQSQSFRATPTDTNAVQLSTIVLSCAVDNRQGLVQWTKNGLALGFDRTIPGLPRYTMLGDDTSGVFDLQISNVQLSDDAEYKCQVGPAPGHQPLQASATLSVQVPPTSVAIEGYAPEPGSPDDTPLASVPHTASFLNITCVAPGAKPAAQLKWYYADNEITAGFLISNTETTDDNGKTQTASSTISIVPRIGDNRKKFKCEATHPTWPMAQSSTVLLNVLYPPSDPIITGYDSSNVKKTGDTITLTCTANGGNPLAQVHWYKNDVKIDYSFEMVGMKSVNVYEFIAEASDNKAVYRCEISNSETPQALTSQVSLDVYYAPEEVKISGHENAKAGDSITLSCTTAPSNPESSISWFTAGRQLSNTQVSTVPAANGGVITISNVTVTLVAEDNQAQYHCHALNSKLGVTEEESVTLDVLFPPPNPPIISGNEDARTLKAGSLKILTCQSFGGNPIGTVTWWKGNAKVEGDISKVGNRATNKITLVLKADDNLADYRCNVTNTATTTPLTAETTLNVIFHPSEVFVIPTPNPAKAGQPVNITCKSGTSNPASTITWLKNGSPISGGASLGTIPDLYGGVATMSYLLITPTYEDDKMEYGCRATNHDMDRSTEDAIKLDVLYPPIFSGIPDTFTVTEGEDTVINMTTLGNPAPSTYTWYKGAEKLSLKPLVRRRRDLELDHFTSTGPLLNITGVKRDDSATYKCEAANDEGAQTHTFALDVLFPANISRISTPVMKSAGNNATLECHVDSNPAVTAEMVTWSREGYDMKRVTITFDATTKTSKLYIPSVEKSDTGNFTCTADNKIGEKSVRNSELIIKYKPEIDKSALHSKAAAEIDDIGYVVCHGEGAPPPTFSWTKKNRLGAIVGAPGTKHATNRTKIDTVHYQGFLMVANMTWADYGDYECTATNELGSDVHIITLDGTGVPDSPSKLRLINSTHSTISLMWAPGFNGGLKQNYLVRYRPTKGLSKGFYFAEAFHHVYTVTGLELGTEYELTVKSRNSKGDSEYAEAGIIASTSVVDPGKVGSGPQVEEVPLVIILSVTIVGVLLLILNIFLIMFFIRRRRKNKMDKDSTDGSSQINTIEMYSTSTGPAYPPSIDDTKSYTTYDKSIDDYPDEFSRAFEDDEDIKKVFLPPMDPYGTYPTHTFDSQRSFVNKGAMTYLDDSVVGAPTNWPQPQESPYKSSTLPRSPLSPGMYEEDIYADQLRRATKTMGSKPDMQKPGPPPPPLRSSSKGHIDIPKAMPPIPARNYGPTEIPRYTPAPGVLYGTAQPQPHSNGNMPGSEMRGALV